MAVFPNNRFLSTATAALACATFLALPLAAAPAEASTTVSLLKRATPVLKGAVRFPRHRSMASVSRSRSSRSRKSLAQIMNESQKLGCAQQAEKEVVAFGKGVAGLGLAGVGSGVYEALLEGDDGAEQGRGC